MTIPQLYRIVKQEGRIEGERAAVAEERLVVAVVVASSSLPRSSSAVVAEELTLPSCSLRLRRRRAYRPAISVTCGSMHRCGYTVLPVGSTKPHEAVSFAGLALNQRRRRARLRLSRRRQLASMLLATAFVVMSVPLVRGKKGGETAAVFSVGDRVFTGLRPPCRELRYRPS
jgi:hypothetical protein